MLFNCCHGKINEFPTMPYAIYLSIWHSVAYNTIFIIFILTKTTTCKYNSFNMNS